MNARKEFEEFILTSSSTVKCASITIRLDYQMARVCNLRVGYTKEELLSFLIDLDLEYDSGYGTQIVFGTIWFKDGSWATRREYDGSEWWQLNTLPEIPKRLL